MSQITPFLWFNDQAETAIAFYVSVFEKAKELGFNSHGAKSEGTSFELAGQKFLALNGGPMYTFTPAISMFISCANQTEIDYYWDALSAGGKPGSCGWLEDKFGLSWQVIPANLGQLLGNPDPQKAKATMTAMLAMQKLDIQQLENA